MLLRTNARYREKKYVCGEFLDIYIYPVYLHKGRPSGRHRRRRGPSRAVQKKLNQRHAEEKLARLMHTNFTEEDLAIGLDYAINPPSREEAKKDIQKYLRKIRTRYKRLGLELKYIWALEQSKKGRFHFHVILSGGMDRDELEKLWGHGRANTKRLQFDEQGITALSKYITKTHRDPEETQQTYRCYNRSKNLIDPEPEINDSKIRSRQRAADLADEDWNLWHEIYPDYEISDIRPFHSDEYGSVYIFARLRRTDRQRIPPKKRR